MDLDATAAEAPRMASDAWTHLDAGQPDDGTRVDLRSLDASETRLALPVGACLPCRKVAADLIWRDLTATKARLARDGTRCTLQPPAWRPNPG